MRKMTWEEAIRHPDFLYVRDFTLGATARPSGRSGVYHRDHTSPTGRVQVAEGPTEDIRGALKDEGKPAALSPTEGLGF